ncbi:MAG: hypothetical protein P1U81_14550 [Verrucomicrobiales bacterium]|nr:hypothetical protein [Verrucomicrobiales bacterium]
MRVFPVCFPAVLALFLTTSLRAQEKSTKGKGRPMPLQGETLPDISGFDEEGNAFPLRQKLKGRHGVIVFGCLT